MLHNVSGTPECGTGNGATSYPCWGKPSANVLWHAQLNSGGSAVATDVIAVCSAERVLLATARGRGGMNGANGDGLELPDDVSGSPNSIAPALSSRGTGDGGTSFPCGGGRPRSVFSGALSNSGTIAVGFDVDALCAARGMLLATPIGGGADEVASDGNDAIGTPNSNNLRSSACGPDIGATLYPCEAGPSAGEARGVRPFSGITVATGDVYVCLNWLVYIYIYIHIYIYVYSF